MNSVPHRSLRAAASATLLSLVFAAAPLRAGGFALVQQNASGAGTCWSDAAAAQDASTVFFNPAGLAWLDRTQVVSAAHVIGFRARFSDAGSTTAGAIPLAGGNGGNAGSATPLPNLHFAQPLTRSWAWGVGLTAPWGLSTDYADGWTGRYHALKSELKTLNVTAAMSWRASDAFALGFGVQAQRASVELSNAIDFGLAGYSLGVPGFAPGLVDGGVKVTGADTATGFVVSMLYEPQAGTRIGATYRSKLKHAFTGDAVFSGVPAPFAPVFVNQKAYSSLATPATFSVHALQERGRFRFTADATWWEFGCFETLAIDFSSPATTDVAQAQNWETAAIYSVGAAWRWTNAITFKAGAAYNTSPVPDAAHRNARIPDGNRRWLSAGVAWKPSANTEVHAGYVHLFFSDVAIDSTDAFTHNLRGSYSISADILSVQGTVRF